MNLKFCTNTPLIMYFSKIEKKLNETFIFCWHQHNFLNFSQYYRTSSNVCKMRTKAYFSILFSLNVCKKTKFFKKYGFPASFSGNPDFSLPELPEILDVGKIRKIRKNYHMLLLGYILVPNFKSNQWLVQKLWPIHFCEDLTRNSRKFDGWFQLIANNLWCGHVNNTKICSNVWKGQILKVTKYEVHSINRKKVIKNIFRVGG